MKAVIWTQSATVDLREAQGYLGDIHEALASDLIDRATAASRFPLDFPGLGTPVTGRWRKWRIPRTRYLIIYRPAPSGIEIGRIRYDRSQWMAAPR